MWSAVCSRKAALGKSDLTLILVLSTSYQSLPHGLRSFNSLVGLGPISWGVQQSELACDLLLQSWPLKKSDF